MATTPEILKGEPQVTERPEEFIVPETLQQAGVKVVQKNFTAQVKSDKGQPLIQTPPAQVITVQPPAPPGTLTAWAKGPISQSLTWLGAFWIRTLKKAWRFGWRIISG
jgi:hypothetical protein